MKQETIKNFVVLAEADDLKLMFVLSTVCGHGGYSSSSGSLTIDPSIQKIEFASDYMVIKNLVQTKRDGRESLFSVSAGCNELVDSLVLEYETVQLIGIIA